MKALLKTLEDKANNHLDKIKTHEQLKQDLQNEVDKTNDKEVERKLLITIKAIEYHKGCAKAYKKSKNMIEESI